ncbi:CDGSH iron-sulfur domain-containing protein [Nocardioides zeae]|uniref:CDGSH iron-sulfur domain-containing protein n=1 Tax=Nocardioides imazamoxiresistens TaxID=3231893 RepID=A0ABU3PQD8_9ACTN|nr:CDGSH iron-sulfur domain-containing protein [Nocardioides zeae]MDT9591437.1 CDGSH iron-sulfur domain-containing protein [Nocardioides zeae]
MSRDREQGTPVRARVCPGGPLLLRGADEVVDADGRAHEVTRPVVAVCLCGATGRAPWCDGTHARIRGAAPGRS